MNELKEGIEALAFHTISKKRYEYKCEDGCCDLSGFEWKVDGKFVHKSPCEDSGWMAVLNSLGIKTRLSGLNEDNEELWEL